MNFYDFNGYSNQNPMMMNNSNPMMMNNQIPYQDLSSKINEIENNLRKLQLRIQRLESSITDNYHNYNEPDTGMYMI